ncbi:MAG: methylaspartate ammonia-lyase [Candidatus Raymondbacteria bacterium RifOxyA12_full_50_37]|uniref:methylaspartate ammonia-lyase n=1 Tax=Candidatus Raymondbacteria bacterium RIFOXYD12_FULL_49_13 TaxID=1817890 RepID=A0A1F7F158_UNCRA|nr:MAG: methylaspartate ammonia-lyase [Candidatus Raymondbacteria bacterium RifOxyB12_full_50_8]OGJ90653.1 MAG: methylaspartate ammonia-lyase [Candidatus Raymondbacteria bacterium RifOxyA12_full_50_37]OGJ91996.1 MAG: methylaspartate ammonia-lyase [Candidatus Raymondbacteria bacterium RIFOXYA2_FULL_49_16]OGK00389.1 MAG: methylaspartate ammonia-lyase [Candidatus Raymondbacteria bacterium RIFOXYD12_FULL_49_13]OGK05404.1 MAG: methylaspartate ammonia-lyase [Candidatus Raymondbacteria bacterium RifOx
MTPTRQIRKAVFSAGVSSFFFDDQRAIKEGAIHDGFVYKGAPMTAGFKSVRVAGQSISVNLLLEDGSLAVGDCAAVQYSGAGGRDPLFLAEDYLPFLDKHIRPMLEGMEIAPFREMAGRFETLHIKGQRLHTAVRYGLSQALLDARALAQRKLKCEVICDEYGLPVPSRRVPIFGQSGDNRYENVDKMILKNIDVLPHGLINNIDEKLGRTGEKLKEYVRWLVKRIAELRTRGDYSPVLHIDVYGTIGTIFNLDTDRIADYLASLEDDAGGHSLYIEGPVDAEEKYRQLEILKNIRDTLKKKGSRVKIVADEWCNTFEDVREFTDARACDMVQIKTPDLGGVQNIVESVLYCKAHGMEAYQGGTCNETDVSARACAHIAVAAQADRMLAKPGMGFDEGYMIVNNEMERILAIIQSRGTRNEKND